MVPTLVVECTANIRYAARILASVDVLCQQNIVPDATDVRWYSNIGNFQLDRKDLEGYCLNACRYI